MTASTATGGGALDIGRVIQQLFQVLGRNFVTFLFLAALLAGLPGLLVGLLQMSFVNRGQLFAWQPTVAGLAASLLGLILQGTIIYGTVTDLNGRRAGLADCLSVGLRSFLPLLGIGILLYGAVFVGTILFVVPGIMLGIAWCVAVPAYVVEQTGILGSFGRSLELTRGNRWRIFGLFVIYIVAVLILELVTGVFSSAASVGAGAGISLVQAVIVRPLIGIGAALIGTVGAAVLYVDLRQIKDGVGPEGLAAIFD